MENALKDGGIHIYDVSVKGFTINVRKGERKRGEGGGGGERWGVGGRLVSTWQLITSKSGSGREKEGRTMPCRSRLTN